MGEGEDKDSKTESATPRRREEAREQGRVAHSEELGRALLIVSALLALWLSSGPMLRGMTQVYRECLGGAARPDLTVFSATRLVGNVFLPVALPLLPVVLGVCAMTLAASAAQVGFRVTPKVMTFKIERFNPVSGAKRMFEPRSLVRVTTAFIKVSVVLAVGYWSLRRHWPELAALYGATPYGILVTVARVTLDLGLRVGMMMILVAALDYAYQRWQFERDMRMSKQEVKEDHKLSEGSPETKSRIRSVQMNVSRTRMLHAVKTADVVVRNPTHYAVALKYDPTKSGAPVVIAKGRDFLAERIIEEARKHRVPITRDVALAQALYKSVKVGGVIPTKLFRAVAKLLVQIYRMRGRKIPVA